MWLIARQVAQRVLPYRSGVALPSPERPCGGRSNPVEFPRQPFINALLYGVIAKRLCALPGDMRYKSSGYGDRLRGLSGARAWRVESQPGGTARHGLGDAAAWTRETNWRPAVACCTQKRLLDRADTAGLPHGSIAVPYLATLSPASRRARLTADVALSPYPSAPISLA